MVISRWHLFSKTTQLLYSKSVRTQFLTSKIECAAVSRTFFLERVKLIMQLLNDKIDHLSCDEISKLPTNHLINQLICAYNLINKIC